MSDKKVTPQKKLGYIFLVLIVALSVAYLSSYFTMKKKIGLAEYPHKIHLQVLKNSKHTEEKLASRAFAYGGGGVIICSMFIVLAASSKPKVIEDLHGSARWAKKSDFEDSNLLAGEGLYVGGYVDGSKIIHLQDNSDTHIMCFAPTRSGKGVSIIIPSLLSNHEKSFFCYDIKGENYALTSGWREKAGNRIIKLELASPDSNKYNPLDEIDPTSPSMTQDVQNLATILTSTGDPQKDNKDHFLVKARTLLTALIIYTLESSERTNNLYYVGNLLTDEGKDIEETLDELIENCKHVDSRNAFISTKNTPERERGSIISTLSKTFELFNDPIIRNNTSSSDFRMRDLVNGDSPVSLYLIVQPNDLSRLNTMVRTFVTQLLNKLISGMEFEDGRAKQKNKHKLILMLDEFASMKNMPIIEEGLAFIAGYGVRAYIIVQDIDQIYKHYGRENGIIGNCHIQTAFAPNSNNTARYLSEKLGKRTIIRKKTSRSYGKSTSRSVSVDEVGRDLLNPEECLRLKNMKLKKNKKGKFRPQKASEGGETLVMISGEHPIKGTRVIFFKNRTFFDRSSLPPAKVKTEKTTIFSLS